MYLCVCILSSFACKMHRNISIPDYDENIITSIFRKVNDGNVIYGEILAESFGCARFIVNQLLISGNVFR